MPPAPQANDCGPHFAKLGREYPACRARTGLPHEAGGVGPERRNLFRGGDLRPKLLHKLDEADG